eukprot:CAMPEP_0202482684 /NCGR_PEP_ID=MMETSP1361-20130828/2062_1 /ASSEMBLY_ACC=CAM_ASM_000849 /TAXON_ID=210615 /ORGANISM="Staurosira complex sp., Strain CCMP2646" /LENGTH=88 /DNA_ID=CAMNT_0049110653 /DNA_START=150 /DNA_END=413 /DNA_ORIENTATION=-
MPSCLNIYMWHDSMSSKCGISHVSPPVLFELKVSTPRSANRFNAKSVRCVVARRRNVNAAKQMTTANATKMKTMPLSSNLWSSSSPSS